LWRLPDEDLILAAELDTSGFPAPSGLALFATSVLGMIGLRRKRKKGGRRVG
jgi:hypothetical protein